MKPFLKVETPGDVRLFAFDSSGALLGSVAGTTTGQFTLSFAAADILAVIITPGSANEWVGVDNITYTPTSTIAPVPEPETYALMGPGLAAVAVARRRAVKARG